MSLQITGHESAEQLIKQLAMLHLQARLIIRHKFKLQVAMDEAKQQLALAQAANSRRCLEDRIAQIAEQLLQWKFAILDIGNYLMPLCSEIDAKASRQAVFDALAVGIADRDSDDIRKYGDKTMHIIAVLGLENSATKDDDIDTRPLKWCHTMAFMNAMQTNKKLDRIVHDGANEFFGGAFGEYREKPLMERLAGRSL